MLQQKTLSIVSLALVGSLFLLGLLSGFVPQTEGPEVRRRVSTHVVVLQPEDMPPPIYCNGDGVRLWSLRMPVEGSPVLKAGQDQPAVPAREQAADQIVSFDKSGVRLTVGEEGLLYGAAASPVDMTPLLALDGYSMPLLVTGQPLEYGDALDSHGRPLRWQEAHVLLDGYSPLPEHRDAAEEDAYVLPPLPTSLGPVYAAGREHYRELVENFARKFRLDINLVYAIIQSESDFRPSLVSHKSAMGLMQLLPSTAGGEVHRFLYGHSGHVSFEELRVPEINIRYGTAYLHILFNRYFQQIEDPLAREYSTVAAYNMGPNRFLRLFGRSNAEAVARINEMGAAELYQYLTAQLPIRETRHYVAKVQRIKNLYAAQGHGQHDGL